MTSRPAPASPAVPWSDVLASLSDAVLLVRRAGDVAAVNPAAETLLGASKGHVLDRPVAGVLAGPNAAWLLELVEQTLHDGRLRRRADAVWRRPREDRSVEATVAPVHDASGALWGAAIVLHDTSTTSGFSAEGRTSEGLATLGATVLGLAHEIRNPLSGIKGAAELLGRELDPDRRARCVSVITHEVDRLNRLVSDLTSLGDPPTLRLEPLNLHRVLSDVLALEQESPIWGNVTLRTDFDPSLPPILGDADRLTQLFLNLVRNALEALGGRGQVRISSQLEMGLHVRRADGRARLVCVRIADDGPGIAPEVAAQIFTPLFSTKARGSGLGLAVSHQIAMAHGGGVAYEPRPGGGSVFLVRLPLADTRDGEL